MLVVDTYLKTSERKGIGLFSSQFIAKGSPYWIRNVQFDRIISSKDFLNLDQLQQDFIRKYAFKERSGNWYLCLDNGRFCNHSDMPNTENVFDAGGELLACIAILDIQADDEILCNYRDLCEHCKAELDFLDRRLNLID